MSFLRRHRHQQQTVAANSAELPISGPLASSGGLVQQNTVVAAPVVQETVRNDRVIEVQPVLHREVDRTVVHHIEKHIQEAAAPSMGGIIERPPLVQDQIRTNVVNEIQPVIHRERAIPVIERQEQHLAQRVVGDTIHTREVIYEQAPMGYGLNNSGSYLGQQAPMGFGGQGLQRGVGLQQGAIQQGGLQQVGTMSSTSSVPLYNAPMMGTPYGTQSNLGNARLGKRHHHGVFHRT